MVDHIIRIDTQVWERLALRQARLSSRAGRHVTMNETVHDLFGENEDGESDQPVICECSPEANPGCTLDEHGDPHHVPAQWRVSPTGDHDDFIYLCNNCTSGPGGSGGLEGFTFELLEQAGGQA